MRHLRHLYLLALLAAACGSNIDAPEQEPIVIISSDEEKDTSIDDQGTDICDCAADERCVEGECRPRVDCATDGCPGMQTCDTESGQCVPGCLDDAMCGDAGACDVPTSTCVCDADHHASAEGCTLTWNFQIVGGGNPTEVAVLVGADDVPHVLYWMGASLRYASPGEDQDVTRPWPAETIETLPRASEAVGIEAVRDEAGAVHVVYPDTQKEGRFRYAHKAVGESWEIESIPVESIKRIDNGIALAVRDGVVHVGLKTQLRGTLYARRYTNGDWDTEHLGFSVYSNGIAAPGIDLALDADGDPHLVWPFDNDIHYAKLKDGRWQAETIPHDFPLSMEALSAEIAIDDAGNIHVGFGIEENLDYVRNNGSGWTDPEGLLLGNFPQQLAMLPTGDVRFFTSQWRYQQSESELLEYRYDGNAWVYTKVESFDSRLRYFDVAVSPTGTQHVVYVDPTNPVVVYRY